MAGLKFLLSSLKDSANVGYVVKVWSDGLAAECDEQPPPQPASHDIFANGVDSLSTVIGDELSLVQWSIGQGSANIFNNNNTVKLNNYKVTGQFDHSVIPCDKLRLAAVRRQRDRTLVYEARYRELMQLLLARDNCPVFRHYAWKEREEVTGELVTYVDKTYGLFSYIRGIGYIDEVKEQPTTSAIRDSAVCDDNDEGGGGGSATLTEIFDDDDDMNVDDQSTRQTDDIIDDDSQTGDASIDEGSASSGGLGKDIGDMDADGDDRPSTDAKKKPRSKGKVTTWTCHQCPKV